MKIPFLKALITTSKNKVAESTQNVSSIKKLFGCTKLGIKKALDNDIFEKKKDFKKFLEINNLKSNSEEFEAFLKTKICPQNIVGEGNSAKVYDLGDYVLRVPRDIPKGKNSNDLTSFKSPKRAIKGRNFGQPIAINDCDISIAKKVPGKALYSEYPKPWVQYLDRRNIGSREANIFFKQLKELSEEPVSLFQEYKKDVIYLGKHKYYIDFFNPNNFLLDKTTHRLNIIDIEPISSKSNQSKYVLDPLIDYVHQKTHTSLLTEKQRKQALRCIEIIKQKLDNQINN